MSQPRTVSNGRDFSQAIKRAILGGGKFCVCCKRERATQVDHCHALQFGGSSDIDNATALAGAAISRNHAQKRTRRTPRKSSASFASFRNSLSQRAASVARLSRAAIRTPHNGRAKFSAKRQGNHKLAAKLRREAKAAK